MSNKGINVGDEIRARYLNLYMKEGTGVCLDIGAKDMWYSRLVELKGYKYTGIDIAPVNPKIIEQDILKIRDVDYIQAQYENQFDALICIDVLEHISDPEIAINNMHLCLKKEGYCYLHVPNLEQTQILFKHPHQPDHFVDGFTKYELKLLFKNWSEFNIVPTFTVFGMLAWEIANSAGKVVELDKLINFKPEEFRNGGWIVVARK